MKEHAYRFSAIKGIQAGREYYVIMCPFKLIPKLFIFNEYDISPEMRAQRTLNKARIPEMMRYMIDNPKEYCFSAITASVDGEVKFTPFSKDDLGRNVGKLSVDMNSSFIINDGQHRRAAIEEALKLNSDLGYENICVVLFIDRGLKRCQQMFADLNKHAVRPSKSLGVLYDHKDPLAVLCRTTMNAVDIFRDMIELEKTSISNRSRKLFTLNSLYNANRALLGKSSKSKRVSKQEEDICVEYWKHITLQFKDWKNVKDRKINPAEFRRDYVHAHGVLLHALGITGNALLSNHQSVWKKKIVKLQTIDWSRKNTSLWEGRAMIRGRMTASQPNLLLTSAAIKQALNVKMTPEEIELGKSFKPRDK